MKTSTAIASHVSLGAVQAGALVGGMQIGAPWWAQAIAQAILLILHAWSAQVNSNTDQQGNKLAPPPK